MTKYSSDIDYLQQSVTATVFFSRYANDQLSYQEFTLPYLFIKPSRPSDCVTSSTTFSHDRIIWHCYSNGTLYPRRDRHRWTLSRLCDHKETSRHEVC